MQVSKKRNIPTGIAMSLALALGGADSAFAQSNETQLLNRLEQLAGELEKVKAELKQMKQKQDAAPAPTAVAAPTPAATSSSMGTDTQLSSYGEITYARPRSDSSATQADIARFVLGYQHRFDSKTKVVAELEIEHAVSSSTDAGEVAVEQVYVEHRLNDTYGFRAGVFLMPLGLINQNHEPNTFYSVNRPLVETAIIPSTLREAGIQMFGEHDNGISWSAGITTGYDLTKWDPLNGESVESPLRTLHQEGQLARSKDLSLFAAIDWRGIPGLRVGAGITSGKASHGSKDFLAPNARVTLADVHAQWTPGAWDFSAVYARGTISGAGELNASFAGAPYLVPKSFDGYYLQAAYKIPLGGDYRVSPFTRIERINTGRSFDGVLAGLNPTAYDTETVWTTGVSFNIAPTVVLKADYQKYKIVKDSDRLNLGLGFSF